MANDYNFITTDSRTIYNTVLDALMEYCNEPLYPGDERRIFGEGIALVFASLFATFNDAAKQRTLQNARGDVLDAIGEMYKTSRAEPASATATFRFSTEEARPENIVIPAGTKITAAGAIYFATTEAAVLQSGTLYVDIPCASEEGGSKYNGYAPGTVNTLVDLIPYISEASNITTTIGGDDGEPYTVEGDNRYRSRIQLSFSQLSTAGTVGGYKYFAMSADPDIIDVGIHVPNACEVVLYPLMKGGALPDDDTIAKVIAATNAEKVRPMTDLVTVQKPDVIPLRISIKYYVERDKEAEVVQAIENDGGAVDKYVEWQTAALGRDINPDELRYYLRQAGANRVEITEPTFHAVGKNEVAQLSGDIVITHEIID